MYEIDGDPNPRIIAVDREESDMCTKCTPGCCIDHEAEHRLGHIETSCDTW